MAIILVIYIQNGHIVSKDPIINNKVKCKKAMTVNHSKMTEEPS